MLCNLEWRPNGWIEDLRGRTRKEKMNKILDNKGISLGSDSM